MSTWCSSNPPRLSERRLPRVARQVAATLLLAAPAAGQPLRQAIVAFSDGSTLFEERPLAPELVARVERTMAEKLSAKFLFLDWIPASTTGAPDAPRWLLELSDGPIVDCEPPAVKAQFRATRSGREAWRYRELEFSETCDLDATEMTPDQLVTRVSSLTETALHDSDLMKALEEQFLSEIVLAKSLAPDVTAQKLYLPLKGLKAKAESEIEVRFANRLDQRLFAHPGDIDGERTQLLLARFACAGIDSGAPGAQALPTPWHPRLSELLDSCPEPWVYMKVYKPNPAESGSGPVPTLDEEGVP